MSSTFVHCFPRWTTIPRRANVLRSSLVASESSCGMSVSSISIIVTSVPKRSKIDANSQPMIPPPRTTSRFGTSVCSSRPVESTQRGDSSPGIGGAIGYEPVATIALREADADVALVEGDRPRVFEAAASLEPRHVVRLEEGRDAAGHLLDDRRLPLVRLREVERGLSRDDAELRVDVARRMECVRGRDPGLRRDAADAETGAAELRLPIDACDTRAQLCRPDRRRVARRAATQDGNVEFHAADPSEASTAADASSRSARRRRRRPRIRAPRRTRRVRRCRAPR